MTKQSDLSNYGMDVKDLETSPFEMIEMLHLRSKIHRYFHELSEDDHPLIHCLYKLISHIMYDAMISCHDDINVHIFWCMLSVRGETVNPDLNSIN